MRSEKYLKICNHNHREIPENENSYASKNPVNILENAKSESGKFQDSKSGNRVILEIKKLTKNLENLVIREINEIIEVLKFGKAVKF